VVRRVVLSLLALLSLTAFAPAPFPRARRGGGEVSLASLQGNWQVVSVNLVLAEGRRGRFKLPWYDVIITGNKWTYCDDPEGKLPNYGDTLPIVVNNKRRPATFDFQYEKGNEGTFGPGIIRQKGDVVEIVFAVGEDVRPISFEKRSTDCYVITLKRLR
jgi:uncharacterized protein (TIGR03067 family)